MSSPQVKGVPAQPSPSQAPKKRRRAKKDGGGDDPEEGGEDPDPHRDAAGGGEDGGDGSDEGKKKKDRKPSFTDEEAAKMSDAQMLRNRFLPRGLFDENGKLALRCDSRTAQNASVTPRGRGGRPEIFEAGGGLQDQGVLQSLKEAEGFFNQHWGPVGDYQRKFIR